MDAIAGQQEQIALARRLLPVIDLDIGIDTQRASQHFRLAEIGRAMILGQQLKPSVAQAVTACVPDMDDMRRGGAQDQRGKRGGEAFVIRNPAAVLRMKPAVERAEQARCAILHRPAFRRIVEIAGELQHCQLRRAIGVTRARETIGDAGNHAPQVPLIGIIRYLADDGIIVARFAPGSAVAAHRGLQCVGGELFLHSSLVGCWQEPTPLANAPFRPSAARPPRARPGSS